MKIKTSIILGVLFFTGCSAASFSDVKQNCEDNIEQVLSEYEEKNNTKIMTEWNGVNFDTSSTGVAQSTDGYYYYILNQSKLVFLCKDTGTIIPVCTKPDCDHFVTNNVEIEEGKRYEHTCDAAYPSNIRAQVHNGKLYADMEYLDMEGAHPLMCANLDGTDKTEVIYDIEARIKSEQENVENKLDFVVNSSIDWLIEDNNVYVISVLDLLHHDDSGCTTFNEIKIYVDRYNLETGELAEELAYEEYIGSGGIIMWTANCGKKIGMSLYSDIYDSQIEDYKANRVFYLIDKETGYIDYLNAGEVGTYFGNIIIDNKLIYHKNSDDIYSIDANGVTEKCIETNDEEKERKLCIHNVGDYICTSYGYASESEESEYLVKIYDKEYNLLETVEVPGDIFACAACDEQILLKASNVDRFYYINTDELGTGNVELHEFKME